MEEPPTHFQRLRDLCQQARGLEPKALDALLERECADGPDLAAEVRRLVAADASGGDVLEGAAADAMGLDSDGPAPVTLTELDTDASDGTWDAFLDQVRSRGPAFSRYDDHGEIARGGMGAIRRVHDHDLRRALAMKVNLAKSDDPAASDASLGRFLEEAQITAQLDHPGIVPIHEVGVGDDGQVYFTMKLVKGDDLRAVFDRVQDEADEEWTTTRALNVLLRVCEAMAFAHEKGVIHRDLKPGNIMVGKYGEAYVMDWGLAKVLGQGDKHDLRVRPPDATVPLATERKDAAEGTPDSPFVTMSGRPLGTPHYMPPEQARGHLEAIGPAADVYAVGATMYELLAGRAPYVEPGDRMSPLAVVAMVASGPPVPLSQLAPQAPAELVAIIEKAMARPIDDRYPDMTALARDLRSFLENRVVGAYETGAWAELKKWVQRNKALAGTAAAALALLAALGSWAYVKIRDQRDFARASEEAAKRSAYVANVFAASAALERGDEAEARDRLGRCDKHLRGWEWDHLSLRADNSTIALEAHGSRVSGLAFRPDGRQLASVSFDDSAALWSIPEGELEHRLEGHTGGVCAVTYSPVAPIVATASADDTIRLWDSGSGELVRVLRGHSANVMCVAFCPDGETLASGADDMTVRLWDVTSGTTSRVLSANEGREHRQLRALSFSPDGASLVAGTNFGSVLRWSISTGEFELIGADFGSVSSLAYIDETTIVLDGFRGIRLLSHGPGEWKDLGERSLTGESSLQGFITPVGIQFAVDTESPGGLVFAGAPDGPASRNLEVFLHDARSFDEELPAPIRLTGLQAGASSLAIARGWIAVGTLDGRIRLWNSETVPGIRDLVNDEHVSLLSTCMGRDARRIASVLMLADRVPNEDPSVVVTSRLRTVLRVWNARRGTVDREILIDNRDVSAMSPDSSFVALGGGSRTGVDLYDIEAGAIAKTLETDSEVTCLTYGPRVLRLAAGMGNGTIKVWKIDGERADLTFEVGRDVKGIAFHEQGERLLGIGGSGTLRVWDLRTRQMKAEQHLTDAQTHVLSVAAGHNLVAILLSSGVVQLRDWQTLALRAEFLVQKGTHGSVALSADGRRVLTCVDRDVELWDAGTGEPLLTLSGHIHQPHTLGFDDVAERIITSSMDGAVLVWPSQREDIMSATMRARER